MAFGRMYSAARGARACSEIVINLALVSVDVYFGTMGKVEWRRDTKKPTLN